jgi:arylsulfatase A-like enzyme
MIGGASLAAPGLAALANDGPAQRRPNVILILTDDQGCGDLGCHGNEKIRTPNIDRLYGESVRLTQFYVCPVSAPTRASLMTGRYNFRTGAIDTFLGRAMMHPDEVTLPEMLGASGYRTGIFGKWHLGDNYPMRAMDQGFQESLVHRGGGIGQPSDPPGNGYFDPILLHNGVDGKHSGYCTDIFTDATLRFMEDNREQPFFAYLSTNAPHTPLEIADSYVEPYTAMGLDERDAKVYGMITNIDDNVGKLVAKLDELGLAEDTIFIFMTDNGPQWERYNVGMRGRKGTVYEGGIRVPCFVRWPRALTAGTEIDRIAAHIDMAPTLLEACGAEKPTNVAFDGVNLMPLLRGEGVEWPDRSLYFQWHRGDEPELYRACAARTQRHKLVDGKELYDLESDPGEQRDISAENPDVVAEMRQGYEEWFRDVGATRGYAPPRIAIGTEFENPVTLTRQDWRGSDGWSDDDLGYWEVEVHRAGTYDIMLRFRSREAGEAHLKIGDVALSLPIEKDASECAFDAVQLGPGEGRLEASVVRGAETVGVAYVDVKRAE